MKVEVLPGYSEGNREWVDGIAKGLGGDFGVAKVYWPHWDSTSQEKFGVESEAAKLMSRLDESVYVVAKSVGTLVLMKVLQNVPQKVEKIVLCGIPLEDLSTEDKENYRVLKDFREENVLVIQNANDNHGTYAHVVEFLKEINPHLRIVSKDRADHAYPYAEEILEFLKK